MAAAVATVIDAMTISMSVAVPCVAQPTDVESVVSVSINLSLCHGLSLRVCAPPPPPLAESEDSG